MNMIKLKKRVRAYQYGIFVVYILYALLAMTAIISVAVAVDCSITYLEHIPLLKRGLVSEYMYKTYILLFLLSLANGKFFHHSSKYFVDIMNRITNIYVYLRSRTTR